MSGFSRLRAEPLAGPEFAPFGFVMDVPDGGRRVGPLPVIADLRATAEVAATLIHLLPTVAPRSISAIERHPSSTQFFLHLSGGGLSLVVFPTQPDGRPDFSGARAFLAAPGQAFGYHPGTWHAGVAALGEPACVASLLSRDGTPGDVDEMALPDRVEVDWT